MEIRVLITRLFWTFDMINLTARRCGIPQGSMKLKLAFIF